MTVNEVIRRLEHLRDFCGMGDARLLIAEPLTLEGWPREVGNLENLGKYVEVDSVYDDELGE